MLDVPSAPTGGGGGRTLRSLSLSNSAFMEIFKTDVIKKDPTKSLSIKQALASNFGLLFDQPPVEALDKLGIACDLAAQEFPGCLGDETNAYTSADVYARIDAKGLSSVNIHVLASLTHRSLLVPNGVTMDDMSSGPVLFRRGDGPIGELRQKDKPPFTIYRPLAKLRLPEENEYIFDKECLYPHTHYVKEVIIGIKLPYVLEGGGVDESVITREVEKRSVEQWDVLWCNMRDREDVKKAFFAKKVSGPMCKNGHPMFNMTLKELAWSKTLDCRTCGEPTTFALQTCKRRCELTGICQSCENTSACNVQRAASEQRRRSEVYTADQLGSPEGVPKFAADKTNVFVRFRMSFDIVDEEYNDDPYVFDGKVIQDISILLAVDPARIAILDVLRIDGDSLIFEVGLLHPSFKLEETRHSRERPEPPAPYKERSLVEMFAQLHQTVKSLEQKPLDPLLYPVLSRTLNITKIQDGWGDFVISASHTYLEGLLLPQKKLCDARMLTCRQCLGASMFDFELDSHLKHSCAKRMVSCELGCGEQLVFDKCKLHLQRSCMERVIVCKCQKAIIAKDLDAHLLACEQKPWTCPKCDVATVAAQKMTHEGEECPFRPVTCNWCGAEARWNNLTTHKNLSCPKRVDMAVALKKACWQLKVDEVKALLQSGANPNTFCGVACSGGHPDDSALGNCLHALGAVQAPYAFAKLLLDHLADAGERDSACRQPLHVAAQHGAYEVCQALLDSHANPQVEDKEGRTPLFIAGFHQRRECIVVLENAGRLETPTSPNSVRRGIMMTRDIEAVKKITAYEERIRPLRDAMSRA